MAGLTISSLPTTPYADQKPGTSGLRKRVKVFQQDGYTANFVQAILSAMPGGCEGSTLVVGGDGRFYLPEAVHTIVRVAGGNKVKKIVLGQHGILSTPAASNLIRKYASQGGILCTASHNPGGPDADFGIKFNSSNGGPAPEAVTNKIFEVSKSLTQVHVLDVPQFDLGKIGSQKFGDLEVEIVDSVEEYVKLMKEIFDFEFLKSYISKSGIKVLFDAMHGVTGPYATRIFVKELGLPASSVMNNVPLPDFGGGHPDPNLTYAHDLVLRVKKDGYDLGFASDGDGDRNMVISKDWFVNPSDSVAAIAHAGQYIPWFKKNGLKGVARSMPTSGALDRVAKKKGFACYETPTGWKFFGNLMDSGLIALCGEESFGTGANHVREKDGVWGTLAWLTIVANEGKSVKEFMECFYREYGRNFFTRWDFEEVDSAGANAMIQALKQKIQDMKSGQEYKSKNGESFILEKADDFEYLDPVDGSVSKNQGLRIIFRGGSRIIFRLSGTGSHGATVRLYIEKYESDASKFMEDPQTALRGLIDVALDISELKKHVGRDEPTVIT